MKEISTSNISAVSGGEDYQAMSSYFGGPSISLGCITLLRPPGLNLEIAICTSLGFK